MESTKLKTAIEREIHSFVSAIKEHTTDYSVLYVRKNMPHIDREQMSQLLELFGKAVDDAYFSKIDYFMNKLDNSLEETIQGELNSPNSKKSGKTTKETTV